MQLTTLSLLASSLLAVCYAAPAHNHALEPRQIFITCINGFCIGPSPTPTPTPTPTPSPSKKPGPKTSSTSSIYKPPTKPSKSTPLQPSKTAAEEVGPSSTRCPVPLYYKCGGWHDGKPWTGCTQCVTGAKCVVQNEWYSQCVAV